MGVLIYLAEPRSRLNAVQTVPRLDGVAPEQSAQILFFTGVRYVRDHSETPAPGAGSASDAPRPRRRRG